MAITVFIFPNREYSHNQIIIAFGDSLTRGYGAPPGENFVTYLSEYVKIPIINAGKTGDTTSDAMIRFKEDVLDKNPDIVLLFLGGNDYLKNDFPADVIEANLLAMIKGLKKISAKTILIGGSSEINSSYEKIFQKLYLEKKVDAYVPNVLSGVLQRKDMLFDSIHPNSKGHEEIAKRILPALEKILREN